MLQIQRWSLGGALWIQSIHGGAVSSVRVRDSPPPPPPPPPLPALQAHLVTKGQ